MSEDLFQGEPVDVFLLVFLGYFFFEGFELRSGVGVSFGNDGDYVDI